MRGPYERLKYDFRRVWECPLCNHRLRTGGDVTSAHCTCKGQAGDDKQSPMNLVADNGRRTDRAPE